MRESARVSLGIPSSSVSALVTEVNYSDFYMNKTSLMAVIFSITANYEQDSFVSWIITEIDEIDMGNGVFEVMTILGLVLAVVILKLSKKNVQSVGPMTFR